MLRNSVESNLDFGDEEQNQNQDRFQCWASRTLEVRILPPTTLGKGALAQSSVVTDHQTRAVANCQLPIAIANRLIDWGATSTEHKLASLIHMTKAETGGGDVYDTYNRSVIALVTDQGRLS